MATKRTPAPPTSPPPAKVPQLHGNQPCFCAACVQMKQSRQRACYKLSALPLPAAAGEAVLRIALTTVPHKRLILNPPDSLEFMCRGRPDAGGRLPAAWRGGVLAQPEAQGSSTGFPVVAAAALQVHRDMQERLLTCTAERGRLHAQHARP